MASCAARLISSGAEKSGKPCERFTALCAIARRVISRITDSVKRAAFSDSSGLVAGLLVVFRDMAFRQIQAPVDGRVALHDFHVIAGLRKRNGIHEFGRLAVILSRGPLGHSVL